MQKNDVLYVSAMTYSNYEMYKDTVDIKNVIIEKQKAYDIKEFRTSFDRLEKDVTYYLLLTHSGDKIQEYENLKQIMQTEKDVVFMNDDKYNLLIKFTKL